MKTEKWLSERLIDPPKARQLERTYQGWTLFPGEQRGRLPPGAIPAPEPLWLLEVSIGLQSVQRSRLKPKGGQGELEQTVCHGAWLPTEPPALASGACS